MTIGPTAAAQGFSGAGAAAAAAERPNGSLYPPSAAAAYGERFNSQRRPSHRSSVNSGHSSDVEGDDVEVGAGELIPSLQGCRAKEKKIPKLIPDRPISAILNIHIILLIFNPQYRDARDELPEDEDNTLDEAIPSGGFHPAQGLGIVPQSVNFDVASSHGAFSEMEPGAINLQRLTQAVS